MRKKTFLYCLIIMSLYFSNILSQYNTQLSGGPAPFIPGGECRSGFSINTNPNSLGYSFYAASSSSSQLIKYRVGSPGTTALVGNAKQYLFGSGDFANPTGVWKFYVIDQNPPYTVYEVDTANGNLTGIGAPASLKNGHRPSDFEWDQTTGSFYIISTDTALTESQIYKVHWPDLNLTWVGTSTSQPAAIIAGGFNANGTYFGIDANSDGLWKANKNTGAWTYVGSLGYPVNYSQDAGFARPDYSRLLWCACGGAVGLFEVDTSNAGINLIGQFPFTQVMASGFIGGQDGPQITVIPYQNTQNLTGPYTINAVVTPGSSPISYTKIFWSRNNPVISDSISMTNSGGNNWTGNIPGNGMSAGYWYYCLTKDNAGRSATAPLGAPTNLFAFIALGLDTSKPVIVHVPIGSTLKTNWPVYVTATASDNFGIDSVWVNWKINYNGQMRHFKLPQFNANIYQNLFNSANSDVNVNDTVFYRIIAQDNSNSHNRDSTPAYGFKIIGTENTCVGSGATLTYVFPFNTLYWGTKSQMLWSAAEISAAGGGAGYITKMSFDIASYDTTVMNNFSVKIQGVLDTAFTSNTFYEGTWTTVYSGTYSVPGTGWQEIVFQNPYQWDGLSSIVVQICYENNAKHWYSMIRIQNTGTGKKSVFEYHDLANACTEYQSPSGWYYRPNTCFKIIPLTNEGAVTGTVPGKYFLAQNYPNPFNPATRIKYEIFEKAAVTLKIYDALGRELKTLVSETKSPGIYTVDFDASALPSGIYFYMLRANTFSQTKRMVLIK